MCTLGFLPIGMVFPEGSEISVTEMEFNRATEVGIPQLCFLLDENYAWLPHHIEGESQKTKLT